MKAWFFKLKQGLKCQRCPENHPAVLQFHHRDPAAKEINLAESIHRGWSKERILREIEKCDVLCANCHLKHHWDDNKSEPPAVRPRTPRAEKCKICGSHDLVKNRAYCVEHWKEHQRNIMKFRRADRLRVILTANEKVASSSLAPGSKCAGVAQLVEHQVPLSNSLPVE